MCDYCLYLGLGDEMKRQVRYGVKYINKKHSTALKNHAVLIIYFTNENI